MTAVLIDEPWEKMSRQSVHFRAEIFGTVYLCRITDLALLDDYRQAGDRRLLEVFQDFQEDILRRAERMLPKEPVVVDGEPTIVIKSGDAMP